jgi:hemerythrin
MGRSVQRELYFRKHIQVAPTPEDYMQALAISPYKTHKRMFKALLPEFKRMLQESEETKDESSLVD